MPFVYHLCADDFRGTVARPVIAIALVNPWALVAPGSPVQPTSDLVKQVLQLPGVKAGVLLELAFTPEAER